MVVLELKVKKIKEQLLQYNYLHLIKKIIKFTYNLRTEIFLFFLFLYSENYIRSNKVHKFLIESQN